MTSVQQSNSLETTKLGISDYIAIFSEIANENGIQYIAMPNDADDYHSAALTGSNNTNPIIFSDMTPYSLVPCSTEFDQPFSRALNVLLYESFMTLVDAGMATTDSTTPFVWSEAGFALNASSKLGISSILLSFDRTVTRLASLAAEHDFCQGKAISPLWLTRTLNEVISTPAPSLKSNLSVALEN